MKQRPVIDVSNNPLALEMVRNELSLMRTDILKTLVDPKRDIDYECGYPKEIRLEHYRQIWQRDGIGTRLINIWPNECWRAGMPEVIEGEEADDSDFEKEWKRLVKSQRLLNHLLVADQISGVGQYGIILLGLDDGKELSQPVEGVTGIPIEWGRAKPPKQERRLIFLRPFSQSNVSIKAIERNRTPGQRDHARLDLDATDSQALDGGQQQGDNPRAVADLKNLGRGRLVDEGRQQVGVQREAVAMGGLPDPEARAAQLGQILRRARRGRRRLQRAPWDIRRAPRA